MTAGRSNHKNASWACPGPCNAEKRQRSADEERRYVEAFQTLPPLTRAVFLLHRLDNLSYREIGWRCGISVDDVTIRMSDALVGIARYLDGRVTPAARMRRSLLLPWRWRWATARKREGDRSLGLRRGRRNLLEWAAWFCD